MDDVRFLENKFYEEIKIHIKRALPNVCNSFTPFRLSTNHEDTNMSFDMVFNLNFTISVRIRKEKYIRYNDLTIRSKSKGNNKTEIDKIKEGMSQVYFYAYMNENETKLKKIRIVNTDAIRVLTNKKKYNHKVNNDGTEFFTYKFNDVKEENGDIYKYDEL
jgi:hypothetical protein